MPNDPAAERALLGAVMLDPDALIEVTDTLRPDDLWQERHRLIWGHIQALHVKGQSAEMVLVAGRLMDAGRSERDACGGLEYVQSLPEQCASSKSWPSYLTRIRDLSTRRRMIAASDHLATEAKDSEDLEAAIASTEAMLNDAGAVEVRPMSAPEVADATWSVLSDRCEAAKAGKVTGLPTGIYALDEAISSSLRPGKLVIVAARPAMGKSALSMQLALYAADNNHGAVVLSLEMPAHDLMMRAWAAKADVPLPLLEHGKLERHHLDRLEDAHKWAHHLPLVVADQPDQTAGAIRAAIRRGAKDLKRRGFDLGVVVVDYLQLVNLQQARGQNKADAVGAVSRALKVMAKELNCCILCLSQLNRRCEERTNKRPLLSDLRDSGAIEQDADLVLFIYRDEVYTGDACQTPGEAELIIAKQRSGPLGTVRARWEGEYTRFSALDRRYAQ
jgi:replicative DNA helicase